MHYGEVALVLYSILNTQGVCAWSDRHFRNKMFQIRLIVGTVATARKGLFKWRSEAK